ncbi:hypothetical protein [Malaciobacter marinus]|jgi:phosphoglycerol transferase MdoB-like AlkP superfamily enzyme|uniref:Iron transporter n=1 Tax=Malaciobacter marinus TaxID=505249 RepID=A0AB36ZWW9_9BACT|nr:hypothetical protein [Malaciobacter marinus]PPK60469.1 hypothetical protein B0F89_12128 [Malaciobacter marinus]SKB62066.1 hypothetical protein SAMN06295997_12423 [Malaciobacter marinus]
MKIIRFIIASFGGYLLTSLATITLTLGLPFENKAEATLFASMISFMIWLLIILYVFSNVQIKKLLFQLASICITLFIINNLLMLES